MPVTVDRVVPQSRADHNGHVNQAHYLEASAQATDRFMELIAADPAYVAAGNSYFAVENHMQT